MKTLYFLALVLFTLSTFELSNGILSGYPIEITQAPYMVYIETLSMPSVDPTRTATCGGSWIRERRERVVGPNGITTKRYSKFILTAGHCLVLGDDLHTAAPSDVMIIYGLTDYTKLTYSDFIQGVKAVHVHPLYNGSVSNGNDVTVLELNNEIEMNGRTTRTIQLNSGQYFPTGTQCIVTGYGTNPNNTDSTSLYQAKLETYSYETCAQSYPQETEEQLRREQICALGPAPMYADACEGDSGGALVKSDDNTQIGIVSYGESCFRDGLAILPEVYTKVGYVMPFINQVTRGYGGNGNVFG